MMPCGIAPRPPVANGTYALTSSISDTSDVPSASDGTDFNPRRCRAAARSARTVSGPSSKHSFTATVLTERDNACVSETHVAFIVPGEIRRRPPAIRHLRIDHTRRRRAPASHRRQIDERFERRARLTLAPASRG